MANWNTAANQSVLSVRLDSRIHAGMTASIDIIGGKNFTASTGVTYSVSAAICHLSSLIPHFNRWWKSATAALLLAVAMPAAAVLTIEINRGVETPIPIAVVPFGLEGVSASEPNLPAAVIAADLKGSGKFAPLSRGDFLSLPHDLDAVKYKDWRLVKAEALVVGRVIKTGDNSYEVRFQLIDVFREKQLVGWRRVVTGAQMRKVGHQISDIIYEELTGKPGAFDTRIAFVTVDASAPKPYRLQVADSDGHGARHILESPHPILSPAWSPNGEQLAYVSFEKKRSIVYVQNIRSGQREPVAEHNGINSAPAWSPEGRRLALTLSKDGNSEIYIYDLASRALRRLTKNAAIDTEPAWSPDGGTIAFTSDRPGTPQIYRIAAAGGNAQRVTFEGKYNADACYSHDGKSIALITNQGNGYRVGLYSAQQRTVSELTRTRQDESPTFAPNGEMIMYATQAGGRHILAAVSPDGRVKQTIKVQNGSVREPAWSPFNRN